MQRTGPRRSPCLARTFIRLKNSQSAAIGNPCSVLKTSCNPTEKLSRYKENRRIEPLGRSRIYISFCCIKRDLIHIQVRDLICYTFKIKADRQSNYLWWAIVSRICVDSFQFCHQHVIISSTTAQRILTTFAPRITLQQKTFSAQPYVHMKRPILEWLLTISLGLDGSFHLPSIRLPQCWQADLLKTTCSFCLKGKKKWVLHQFRDNKLG